MCLREQAQGSKVEKVYNEIMPVNAASELRKRPPSLYASSKGNVMQKAKVAFCASAIHSDKTDLSTAVVCVCEARTDRNVSPHCAVSFSGVGIEEGDLD